jgi:hypothetical protein
MFTFCITVLFHTQSSDDDDVDRLNRKYTVYGLIALAVISGSRLFNNNISSLISCWNRANFPSAYIHYTNYICFITHSYRVDSHETIPSSIDDRLLFFFSLEIIIREKTSCLFFFFSVHVGKSVY